LVKIGICLNQASDVLKYARLFEGDDLSRFITLLNQKEKKNCYIEVLLASFAQLVRKLCSNTSESYPQVKEMKEMLSKKVIMIVESSASEEFLRELITHLADEYNSGVRFEPSELDTLRNVLEMSISSGLIESSSEASTFLFKKLKTITSVLKWYNPLKLDLVKRELNRREQIYDELAADILCLESLRGKDITKKFTDLIKTVEIEDSLLRFINFSFTKLF
jgi:hypothetical protein